MEEKDTKRDLREFGPFISECRKRGIGRTTAYELRNAGLLDTFKVGARTFVYIDSILSLPARLPQQNAA